MRIAMLHIDLPPATKGGVAYQAHRLSNVLFARGHDVVVHTLSEPPSDARYDVEQIPLGAVASIGKMVRMVTVPIAFAARSLSDYDVVHAHGDSHLMRWCSAPLVRTFYGSARDEAKHAARHRRRLAQRALYLAELMSRRLATVTVGISKTTERAIGALDAIIPCGVDTDLFAPGPKSVEPSILFVGTLHGRKRGHALVRWFETEIRPAVPDAQLWLVADQRVDGAGIHSFDRLDDMALAALYRRAWCLALPSTYEGFGVPYIEAMASGTAVVATPNDGSQELFGAFGGGLVVDDVSFGDAVIGVLRDSDARVALERAGRAAAASFAWDAVATQYERVYERALQLAEVRR